MTAQANSIAACSAVASILLDSEMIPVSVVKRLKISPRSMCSRVDGHCHLVARAPEADCIEQKRDSKHHQQAETLQICGRALRGTNNNGKQTRVCQPGESCYKENLESGISRFLVYKLKKCHVTPALLLGDLMVSQGFNAWLWP
jgi:hypothetical protein